MIIAELSTDYNLSGGGDVRAESVVQRGKQGSGDQSPVTSPGYHYHTPHHTSDLHQHHQTPLLTCLTAQRCPEDHQNKYYQVYSHHWSKYFEQLVIHTLHIKIRSFKR